MSRTPRPRPGAGSLRAAKPRAPLVQDPIAIIGAGCRFPGADSLAAFWALLDQGIDAVTEVPDDRFTKARYLHPKTAAGTTEPGTTYTFAAGTIGDVSQFDPPAFNLSPREAQEMDPQQRILLEVTRAAIEDAGWSADRLAGSQTGVFVGASSTDFWAGRYEDTASLDRYGMTGGAMSIMANRIAHVFDLHGASQTVDTACSSSLVALHLACEALRTGQLSAALVGGVNMLLAPAQFVGFSRASMLSPTGRCHAFDARADGYVRAEGAGVVLIKRLADAIADGDTIRAVIRGTGTNSAGRTVGLSLPNRDAQAALLRDVLARSGLSPAQFAYFEAHGTGTLVGDPIEAWAISNAIAGHADRADGPALTIGSVKTNIGHLESASGMAGLLKAMLVLQHGHIPQSLHFDTPNPNIAFADLRLDVAGTPRALAINPDGLAATAIGINSFGFGGTNGSAMLTGAPAPTRRAKAAPRGLPPLLLSAHAPAALRGLAAAWLDELGRIAPADLPAYLRGAARFRDLQPHRLVLRGASADALRQSLSAWLANTDPNQTIQGATDGTAARAQVAGGDTAASAGGIVLVYSGNGAQIPAMAQQAAQHNPRFRAALAKVDAVLAPLLGWSPLHRIRAGVTAAELVATDVAQPLLFAAQVAITETLRAEGIIADTVLGHSVGEVAAAWAAGLLDLPTAARLIVTRSAQQHRQRGIGRMAALGCPLDEALPALAEASAGLPGPKLEIAAENGPRALTVAGPEPMLARLEQIAAARRWSFITLELDYAFHSAAMDPVQAALVSDLAGMQAHPPSARMVSTVTAAVLEPGECTPDYWWHNLRDRVRFRGAVHTAAAGARLFIEIGGNPVLQSYLRDTLQEAGTEARLLASLSRRDLPGDPFPALVDRAVAQGADPRQAAIYAGPAELRALPLTPLARVSVALPRTADATTIISPAHDHRLLGFRRPEQPQEWQRRIDTTLEPWLADHRFGGAAVLPAAGMAEMALAAAALQWPQAAVLEVAELRLLRMLPVPDDRGQDVRLSLGEGGVVLSSRTHLSDEGWTDHAIGQIGALNAIPTPEDRPHHGRITVSGADIVAMAAKVGLDYGPAFQPIVDASLDPAADCAVIRLALPDAAPSDDGFLLHPVRFDGALQGLIALLAQGDGPLGRDGAGMVPSHIGRLLVQRGAAPPVLAEIAISRRGSRSVVANIVLRDAVGTVVARAWDCWMQRVSLGQHAAAPSPVFRFDLLPALDAATRAPDDLLPALRAALPSASDAINEAAELLRGCVLSAAFAAFAAEPGSVLRPRSAYAQALLAELALSQLAVPVADGWRLLHDAPLPDASEIWRVVYADRPDLAPELAWIADAIDRLPAVLRASAAPTDAAELVLLPPEAETTRRMAAELAHAAAAFAAAWPADRPLRVLDLGSRGDLPATLAASGRRVLHVAVHPPGEAGDRAAHSQSGALESSSLAWDAALEGAKLPEADLVVGLSAHLRFGPAVLPALRAALAEGGTLLLAEPAAGTVWNFVGGQSPSWWGAQGATLLDAEGWTALLHGHGFQDADLRPLPDMPLPAAIVTARLSAAPSAAAASTTPARPAVLIGRHGALRSALHAALLARGTACDLLDYAPPADPEQVRGRDVIVLPPAPLGISNGGLAEVLATLCALAQTCADRAESLVLITEGGQQSVIGPHHPPAAACFGMARVLANEYAPLRLRRVDISPGLEPALAAQRLVREVLDATDGESEVVLTGSARLVPRLRRGLPAQDSQQPARLVIRQPGQLGTLAWDSLPSEEVSLAEGELRIKIEAAGLNFRDVMWAQGLLPEDVLMHGYAGATLGMEAAGRVEATGPGVRFAVGDRVFGFIPGAFASRVVVRDDAVTALPGELTAEQAATVPVTFMTAVYALETCARLAPGERVLIHGGAGGVGLAAIQVAKAAGAQIAASAGSRAKRAFLRQLGVDVVLDSRDLGFADALRQVWPDGVDVVLNSLAGAFMDRSLSLVRPFGRFVELGKRDYVENRRTALRPMRQNVTYFAVDVDQLPLARPDLAQRLLAEISARMAAGTLQPLPATVFGHADVETGFRMLQGSTHIGKIVIRPPQGPAPSATLPALASNGTVVVVGGMQGFGLQAAHKLAELGVRHLALISRRGGATEGAMEALAGLAALGAQARVYACDATDANALAATLAAIRAQGEKTERQPIIGVVHAAAVLDDGAAASLTAARFAPVLAAKLTIAENLDRLTASDPLTLFLMFSSATTALGNPGQANYVAANAALEALAQRRRAAGRPALAIGWGPIEDVGMLARDAATAETLRRRLGVDAMTAAEALAGLPALLGQTQTATPHYARVDWTQLADMLPLLGENLFSSLRADGSGKPMGSRDMLERLRSLPPGEAAELLRDIVRQEIGGILQLAAADLALDVPLPRLGLDSLGGMELRAALEGRLGIPVPLASVSDTLTIEVLVLRIRDAMSGQQLEDAAAASVIARHEGEAVSPTAMLTTQAVEARP